LVVKALYLCSAGRDRLSSHMQQVNTTTQDEIMAEQGTWPYQLQIIDRERAGFLGTTRSYGRETEAEHDQSRARTSKK
jgi:hypothetical protein